MHATAYEIAKGRSSRKGLGPRTAKTETPAQETTETLRIVDAATFRPAGLAASMTVEPWQREYRSGVLALGQAMPNGAWIDRYYHVGALDSLLAAAGAGRADLYVTQAVFSRRDKSASNLLAAALCHVDLDLYRVMSGDYTVAQIIAAVLAGCDDAGVPRPSNLVMSGRGCYAKWLFPRPVPRRALGKVRLVNIALAETLAGLAADPKATDVSRVLRVLGSINSKSPQNGPVRVIWTNETPSGDLVRYTLDQLGDALLAKTAEDVRAERADRAGKYPMSPAVLEYQRERAAARQPRHRRAFPVESWAQIVLADLDTLVRIRWHGVVPEGHRHTVTLIAGAHLARLYPPDLLPDQLSAWVSASIGPDYAGSAEFRRTTRSLLRKAKRDAAGDTVQHDGRDMPVMLTYSIAEMIRLLGITPDEQQRMRGLIQRPEKLRRRNVQRQTTRQRSDRPNGTTGLSNVERAEKRARMAQIAHQLHLTMSWPQVVTEMERMGFETTVDAIRAIVRRSSGQ